MTTSANELTRMLNIRKPYTYPVITAVRDISPESLRELVFASMVEALETTGTDTSSLTEVDFVGHEDDVQEKLDVLKQDIQETFNRTLLACQTPYRKMDKVEKQIVSIRDSKNPSKARLDVLFEELAGLHEEGRSAFPAFIQARRAEEFFRAIPFAYKSQNDDDWVLALSNLLLTDSAYDTAPFLFQKVARILDEDFDDE